MNHLIVLTVKNLKTKLRVTFYTAEKITILVRYICQTSSHLDSESLHIYGLISIQRFHNAKFTKAVKK